MAFGFHASAGRFAKPSYLESKSKCTNLQQPCRCPHPGKRSAGPLRYGARRFLCCFLCLATASPVFAHPVPSENHDRTILVRLTPTAVIVHYRLELDESRAIRDIPQRDRG